MKLFKKREKENIDYEKSFTKDELIKEQINQNSNREELLEEYSKLDVIFKANPSEETRLRMVEISEQLTPKSLQKKEKKPFKLFKKKEKFEEKYCHTCKHNISFHHKKGRSTGCRKCGCLRTIEEIMNPTDNGHDNKIIILDDNPVLEGDNQV